MEVRLLFHLDFAVRQLAAAAPFAAVIFPKSGYATTLKNL